jgi:hypothetical protein
MGMTAKDTGRLPVRTDETVRLVWYEDGDVKAPEGQYGWVEADKCEVSGGAWVVSVRLLSDTQLAAALSAPSDLKKDLAAVRTAFRGFEVVGEEPHKMKRKERLTHFRAECAHFPNLVFLLGTHIRIRSQGGDPNLVFAELFRGDEDDDGSDST